MHVYLFRGGVVEGYFQREPKAGGIRSLRSDDGLIRVLGGGVDALLDVLSPDLSAGGSGLWKA